ncbi:NAD(P)H-binding protein [Lacticaseibacillus mingshuiensis]|uniref:NAD(P)H-binding protein n=1 Tax=Lacticaseibacillus mingshuiensis TaxID=2799574 RepID=A0ABW4CFQ1_9LACO|nr:NAD(P)H-binding protein [Lacticaseibacillus mingshuiensis]
MKLLILGASGQIARIIETRILNEDAFQDVELTLFLRNSDRLASLKNEPRVSIIDGDLADLGAVTAAVQNQDLVLLATVDTDPENEVTRNVIKAMQTQGVARLLAASSIGIDNEEPNRRFHAWNQEELADALPPMRQAGKLLTESGLAVTILRFAWMNNGNEIRYTITNSGALMAGGSGSRKSMADAILKIVADPNLYVGETIGIADPTTKDAPSAE